MVPFRQWRERHNPPAEEEGPPKDEHGFVIDPDRLDGTTVDIDQGMKSDPPPPTMSQLIRKAAGY